MTWFFSLACNQGKIGVKPWKHTYWHRGFHINLHITFTVECYFWETKSPIRKKKIECNDRNIYTQGKLIKFWLVLVSSRGDGGEVGVILLCFVIAQLSPCHVRQYRCLHRCQHGRHITNVFISFWTEWQPYWPISTSSLNVSLCDVQQALFNL